MNPVSKLILYVIYNIYIYMCVCVYLIYVYKQLLLSDFARLLSLKPLKMCSTLEHESH